MFPANRFPTKLTACIAAVVLSGASFSASASSNAVFVERSLISQGAQISHHRLTGRANFIGTQAGNTIALPGTGTPQNASAAAMDALNAYGAIFGLNNPASELSQKSLRTTANGRSVVRYQQNYNGIPIIGGELIVNLSANNGLLSINGEIAPKLAIPTTATITVQQARDTALSAVAKWHGTAVSALAASAPILSVYDPKLLSPNTSPAKLVWRIEVSSTRQQPIHELVLIDAQSGHISLHFNQVDTALQLSTHDTGGTSTLPGTQVCTQADLTCAAGSADAKSAHTFAQDTYSFYSTTHTRDGIDNAGSVITSTVNWDDGASCPNAFWNGTQMVYCAGLVVDDVVAHELTHGVTENTSNLFYYYQSGAINESFSDLWGEFVDLDNGVDNVADRWLMGEDLNVAPMIGAIRSMKNPPAFNDPDRIGSAYYYTGSGDNGGVHINSGVNNKAVYLMADGDTFNGQTITGIGITKVAKIYYEVQTNLLTSGADYLDLYNALYQGCQNLIVGGDTIAADCTQVRAATDAVEMNQEPSTNFNPDSGVCLGNQAAISNVFSDDIESGLGNWTLTNTGGTNWVLLNATYATPYATSGIESLLGENITSTSDQRAAITVSIPTGWTFLHFKHAVQFESTYDGGVLEYSTNGGTTWTDAGSLIVDGLHYNGTISPSFGNPLAGRSAFTNPSHGYVSTLVNLSSMASQTIQLRWRVGTDGSIGSYGWFVDDVSVNTCPTPSTVALSSTTYSVNENGGSVTVTVSRTGSSTGAVTVNYATASGSATAGIDFSSAIGTLSWADGELGNKTFSVTILDDTASEGSETVNLTISGPSGAILGTSSAILTINDNDSSGGGGGGALGWPLLLFGLLLLPLRRRLQLTA